MFLLTAAPTYINKSLIPRNNNLIFSRYIYNFNPFFRGGIYTIPFNTRRLRSQAWTGTNNCDLSTPWKAFSKISNNLKMLKLFIPLLALITTHINTRQQLLIPLIILVLIFPAIKEIDLHTIINQYLTLNLISSTLIILTIWISRLIISGRAYINFYNNRRHAFSITVLSLLLILLMAFSIRSLLGFYIFFEASLLPTIVLIIGWGYQPERIQAAIYFVIYTIIARLPLLITLLIIKSNSGTTDIFFAPSKNHLRIFFYPLTPLFISLAFLVKIPIYTTHLWLPKAHVEAPLAGSIVLAAILLKLGGYGIMRAFFCIPVAAINLQLILISISLLGGIATRLICTRQTDIKSLIAYSSVGHIALIIGSILTLLNWGWEGALIIIIAHGVCSSAIFFLAFTTYQTTATRRLYLTKGILITVPTLTLIWFIFTAINIAAPPSLNLAREVFIIFSIIIFSIPTAIPLILIGGLRVAYSLILYTSSQHGTINFFSNPLQSFSSYSYLRILFHALPPALLILSLNFITF